MIEIPFEMISPSRYNLLKVKPGSKMHPTGGTFYFCLRLKVYPFTCYTMYLAFILISLDSKGPVENSKNCITAWRSLVNIF